METRMRFFFIAIVFVIFSQPSEKKQPPFGYKEKGLKYMKSHFEKSVLQCLVKTLWQILFGGRIIFNLRLHNKPRPRPPSFFFLRSAKSTIDTSFIPIQQHTNNLLILIIFEAFSRQDLFLKWGIKGRVNLSFDRYLISFSERARMRTDILVRRLARVSG